MNDIRYYEINEVQYNAICNHLDSAFKEKRNNLATLIKYSDFCNEEYGEIKRQIYELKTLSADLKDLAKLVPVFSVGDDEEI